MPASSSQFKKYMTARCNNSCRKVIKSDQFKTTNEFPAQFLQEVEKATGQDNLTDDVVRLLEERQYFSTKLNSFQVTTLKNDLTTQ